MAPCGTLHGPPRIANRRDAFAVARPGFPRNGPPCAGEGLATPPGRPYLGAMGRLLIATGIALVLIGVLWGPLSRLGLGRLPGDIVIERQNFTLYIPVTSAILVSVALSVVLAVLRLILGR